MVVLWLIILLAYGVIAGWQNIPTLFWLLLIPFLLQDWYDHYRKWRN